MRILNRITGLGRFTPQDLKPVLASRRRRNAVTLKAMSAVIGVLVLVQSVLILLDGTIALKTVVQGTYFTLFLTGFVVSALVFTLWSRWPGARGQNAYMLFVLAEGVGLTLCDLQLSGDYSTYILCLFGTALLFSAPLEWYLGVFLGCWATLVAGIALTAPFPLGTTAVASSGVLTLVGMVAGLILEARRIRTELLTLELNRRNLEWKEASLRDALTGLYNRRFLLEWMEKQVALARRKSDALSLALVDLDHFKLVNDLAGHDTGDEVLKAASQWLVKSIRDSDVVSRYGGEEFVVILPETGLEGAETVLGRCLELFRCSVAPSWGRTVTFSAGLTSLQEGETVKELFQRADDLLYRAKDHGRNRIQTG